MKKQFLVLIAALIFLNFVAAAEEETIAVITAIQLKAGYEDAFVREIKAIRDASRARLGNLAWYVQQSKDNSTQFTFYTRWVNEAALQRHLNTPPIDSFIKRTASMMAEPVQVIRYSPMDL